MGKTGKVSRCVQNLVNDKILEYSTDPNTGEIVLVKGRNYMKAPSHFRALFEESKLSTQLQCTHNDLSNDGFSKYHYCIKCHFRIHIIMKGKFDVVRFVPCLEMRKEPKQVFGTELPCICGLNIKFNDGERIE